MFLWTQFYNTVHMSRRRAAHCTVTIPHDRRGGMCGRGGGIPINRFATSTRLRARTRDSRSASTQHLDITYALDTPQWSHTHSQKTILLLHAYMQCATRWNNTYTIKSQHAELRARIIQSDVRYAHTARSQGGEQYRATLQGVAR